MGHIRKLVVYTSDEELQKHAASFPCLVNFNPFDRTGEIDDGVGHYAFIQFVVADPNSTTPHFPHGQFDNVEFIGFPMPASLEE
jgi:hypothetical protein